MTRTILIALLVFFSGCANVPAPESKAGNQGPSAERLMVVDCLLPGQIRKLGQNMSFLAPRRAVKTSAVDCEIRGGEYVAFDRANYATALKIWLPQAKQGDPASQTYVGEIYEKGLGVAADYALALHWYRQAAEQGYSRAQINLGYLYEGGLGVPRDPVTAMNWYRKASGLDSAELEYVSAMEFARREAVNKESAQLKQEVKSLHAQLEQTRTRLEKRKGTLAKAERELLKLQKDLESRKRNIDPETQSPSETDLRSLQMDVQLKLAQRLRETQQEQQRLITKLASEQLKSGELSKQLSQQKKQIGTRKQELESSHQELEQARRQLQGLEASADKGSHSAEIQRLKGKTQTLVALVATQQKEIAALETERQDQAQLAQEKLALEQDLESRNQEIASLQTALAEEKERLQAMQTMQGQLSDLQQDQQRLTAKLSSQQLEAQGLRKELDKVRGQLSQRKNDLDSSKTALQQTVKQLEQARQVSSPSQKDDQKVAALQTKQSDLQAMIKTQQQEMDWLEQEMKAQQQTLAKQLQVAQRGEEQLTQTLRERDENISSLREQLALAQQQLQRSTLVEGQVQALEKELQGRQTEIEKQKQDIARLQRDLSQQTSQLGGAAVTAVVAATTVGPSIELIDPPLSVTRGTHSINLRSEVAQVDIIGRVTSSQELYSFRINDRDQVIETGGLFRAKMDVKTPNTPVNMVAVDRHGERAAVDFLIVPRSSKEELAATPIPPIGAVTRTRRVDFGNYYALVIGNNNYKHFTNLSTAVNDARQVDRMLRDKYGFKTKLLIDADRYAMLSALNELREQLTDEDNLLIYYAGHGELDNVNLRGYWLPVDAEADSSTNWISNVAITDVLNAMSAKHVLVVADSCYSGSMTRSSLARLSPGMSEQARQRWLKVMAKTRTRAVLTSGGVKPVLDSGAGGDHSIFAQAFLDVLRENNAILEGFSLYRAVQRRVKDLAAALQVDQDPQYAPIKYAGHEAGEFFLLPRDVKVGRWSPEHGPQLSSGLIFDFNVEPASDRTTVNFQSAYSPKYHRVSTSLKRRSKG